MLVGLGDVFPDLVELVVEHDIRDTFHAIHNAVLMAKYVSPNGTPTGLAPSNRNVRRNVSASGVRIFYGLHIVERLDRLRAG